MTIFLKKFKSLKIGIPNEFLDGLDSNVREVFDDSIKMLEANGCSIKKISLKSSKLGVSAYQVVAPAECSSNLSRFDGVRYGYRAKDVKNIDELSKTTSLKHQNIIFLFILKVCKGYYAK